MESIIMWLTTVIVVSRIIILARDSAAQTSFSVLFQAFTSASSKEVKAELNMYVIFVPSLPLH